MISGPSLDVGRFLTPLAPILDEKIITATGRSRDHIMHTVLTCIVDRASPWRLARALVAAGGPTLDELTIEEFREHLREGLHEHDPSRRPAAEGIQHAIPELVAAALDAERQHGFITPDDFDLSILGGWVVLLGIDLAHVHPAGTIRVLRAPLTGRLAGLHLRRVEGDVILVGDTLAGDELRQTLAHELAHAMDPDEDVCALGREAFADHLGPALLEQEPPCLADAAPLIVAALSASAARRHPKPPKPAELERMLAWALIRLEAA